MYQVTLVFQTDTELDDEEWENVITEGWYTEPILFEVIAVEQEEV